MRGAILVTSTRPGVRPLGVRGEPLHNAQAQLRAVVRRRLGDRHFHLLAEPEPHALGGRIDWYCAVPGDVRALTDLPEPERDAARADIDGLLADIDRTGQSLETGPTEDGRLAGRSLRLFLVGDQPVVVCWGYDTEAAGAVLPASFLPTAQAAPPAAQAAVPEPWAPPAAAQPVPPLASAPAAEQPVAARAVAAFPWPFWLLAALMAILLLMLASWVLRHNLPVDPDVQVTVLPPPPPPPPPPPVYDPTPDLNRQIEATREEEARLRATLASLRDELARRLAQCKPPDKPPDLPEDRWNRRDLSILEGCWQLGEPTPATLDTRGGSIPGRYTAGRLCFDKSGRGTFEVTGEFPGHPTIHCKGPITAVFQPDGKIRVQKPQSTCADGTTGWRPSTYTCRRVSDDRAMCATPRGREDEFRREGR
jgi:hypothetical protein